MTRTSRQPIEALGARIPLSWPGEPRYIEATHIWSRSSEQPPLAVAHCRSTADVQEAVRAAQRYGVPLSVRGGGHDWAGRALCPGLVIDLSPMRSVAVEAGNGRIRMGGGTRAGDLFPITDAIGRAVVTGTSGAVGMGGLTLGGGYGALIGRYGLVLDNLLQAEVVLADGSVEVADERTNTELFWALRGGGGNFGVVTEMRHRLHPLSSVYSGMILYPFAQAEQVLAGCADFLETAGDDLTVQIGLLSGPDGQPVVLLAPTWAGPAGDGERSVAPLTRLGTPLVVALETKAPGAANSLFDGYIVNGQRVFMETRSLPDLGAASIDAMVVAIATRPSPGCAIVTHEFRGAAARVPVEATAFGLRSEHVLIEIVATADDREGSAAEHQSWASRVSRALAPLALSASYVNLLATGDPGRVRASFGPNAERLALAKRRFDPDHVFASAIPLPHAETQPSARSSRH